MRGSALLVFAAAVALSACNQLQPPTTAAPVRPTYEAVAVNGSATSVDHLFRINIQTGAASVHCCEDSNTDFSPITETGPPLPPGDYHLKAWGAIAPDGTSQWNVFRFDNISGRAWAVTDNNGAYSWKELNATSPSVPQ